MQRNKIKMLSSQLISRCLMLKQPTTRAQNRILQSSGRFANSSRFSLHRCPGTRLRGIIFWRKIQLILKTSFESSHLKLHTVLISIAHLKLKKLVQYIILNFAHSYVYKFIEEDIWSKILETLIFKIKVVW